MITSVFIKDVASYDSTGVQINDLKKVNFVYGANGSGKTTISNLLAHPEYPKFNNCNVIWEHGMQLQSLVYNKEFRDTNFGKGTIEGVFTLGEATAEEIELIRSKEAELGELKSSGIQKRITLDKQKELRKTEESGFRDRTWDRIYKKYEKEFKEAFAGSMKREKFKDTLIKQHKENESELCDFNDLKDRSKTIFGETPVPIAPLPQIVFKEMLELEEDGVWETKIIGKDDVDIAPLIQKLNINDWVNQGRSYVHEDNVCPFCQSETVDQEFRNKLEDYFDETFTASITKIELKSQRYNALSQELLKQITKLKDSEVDNERRVLDVEALLSRFQTLLSQMRSNKELLNNKLKEPSRSVSLVSTKEQLDGIWMLIDSANKEVTSHNGIVTNYGVERIKLISDIWKFIVNEFHGDINEYLKKIVGIQKGVDNIEADYQKMRLDYKTLDSEIKELNSNVTSIQPSIDKINSTLKYFGFHNFEIVPADKISNHYQLQREDGEPAEASLSEGEITFITFLYFMQLAKGSTNEEDVSQERILVIDDPISSLDSTILFVVSTLIKGVMSDVRSDIGNIKQVILLTHNVYFHKEASFINGRIKSLSNTNYWILRKNHIISSIQPYGMENPIQTSYELLWKELKNTEHNSRVSIQNTMRRIIENYFKILGKYGDDELIQKFVSSEEQDICRSLICWINDGSHSISDDLFIEIQDDAMDRYHEVFKQVFVLTNHEGHYNMMMEIPDS